MKIKHRFFYLIKISIAIVLLSFTMCNYAYASSNISFSREEELVEYYINDGYCYVKSDSEAIAYVNSCISSFNNNIKLCFYNNGTVNKEYIINYLTTESGGNSNFGLLYSGTYSWSNNNLCFNIKWVNEMENSYHVKNTSEAIDFINERIDELSTEKYVLYFFNEDGVNADELEQYTLNLASSNVNTYKQQLIKSFSYKKNNNRFTFAFDWKITKEESMKIENKVANVASSLNSGTNYEKIKKVHDYICDRIVYCHDTANGLKDNRTAYDGIIGGYAVCDGYAQAFQLFMDKMGIESHIFVGKLSGESHAWNVVNLDGNWYHLDCTWDDQTSGIIYNYFLIGSNSISYKDNYCITISKNDYPKAMSNNMNVVESTSQNNNSQNNATSNTNKNNSNNSSNNDSNNTLNNTKNNNNNEYNNRSTGNSSNTGNTDNNSSNNNVIKNNTTENAQNNRSSTDNNSSEVDLKDNDSENKSKNIDISKKNDNISNDSTSNEESKDAKEDDKNSSDLNKNALEKESGSNFEINNDEKNENEEKDYNENNKMIESYQASNDDYENQSKNNWTFLSIEVIYGIIYCICKRKNI